MVKITIIGWYGTETLGDRAILAGIFTLLEKTYGQFEVQLGSIYPFFSERTLLEDEQFLRQCANNQSLKISLFDTQRISDLDASIQWCEILIMGGGPLMGFWTLYMVEYAFARAKKKNKLTIIMGCGVGPMILPRYERSLVNIVEKADICVFRDQISLLEYTRLAKAKKNTVCSSIDPAVFAAQKYQQLHPGLEKKHLSVACLRDFPMEYAIHKQIQQADMNARIQNTIHQILQQTEMPMKFIPMHYFAIGDDDRYFLHRLKTQMGSSKVDVQHTPLNLEETFYQFSVAKFCVGMRYHAVVLQSILNGNNIVLNYTDPKIGKIYGFLQQMGLFEFYIDKYVALQKTTAETPPLSIENTFRVDPERIKAFEDLYVQAINSKR